MMNKKDKADCCKDANPQIRTQFTPFTNLRKSFRRLKQRKVKKALSIDSLLVDVPPNKKQSGKYTEANKQKCKNNHNGKENSRNILKRFTLGKRSSDKGNTVDIKVVDNNRFSIIEWSSCESLAEPGRVKARKHNSLRRSRASLFIPTDGLVEHKFMPPTTTKITRYNSVDQINQPKISLKENKWHSSHNVAVKSSPELKEENSTSELTSAAKKKKVCNKRTRHSLSLSNINEHKDEEETNIDIGDIDEDVANHNVIEACCDKINLSTDISKGLNKIVETLDVKTKHDECDLHVSNREKKTFVKLYSKSICASTPALNRPPVPSAPKPISRRDRILKSASTEGLSPRKFAKNHEIYSNNVDIQQFIKMPEKFVSGTQTDLDLEEKTKSKPLKNTRLKRPLSSCKSMDDMPAFIADMGNVWKKCEAVYTLPLAIAEAVWDQTSLNDDELMFSSGDVINVLFKEDEHWWWGMKDDQEGWFPASYVRLRVVQELSDDHKSSDMVCKDVVGDANIDDITDAAIQAKIARREKIMAVRAKCVEELLNTEKDYVKLLKNIIEGYLNKVREDPVLFSSEDADILFANIEQLYEFHKIFLQELQDAIVLDKMEISVVGDIFLRNYSKFEIYSQYCNNQPRSSARLSTLTREKKYKMFFEACRLRQNMIRLSLDGFLLSPVQRICKYPLQLKELLKHTQSDHEDYKVLVDARKCMQNVASLINERKRRLENVNKLARWQLTISNWRDADVVARSSDLLHKGVVHKISDEKAPVERVVFLFDHQLIYFKKDFTKRESLSYCGRIDLDSAIIENVEDNTISTEEDLISNAWRIFNSAKKKWYYFYTDCLKKKEAWMKALEEERKHVKEELEKGFVVSAEVRTTAMENAYIKHIAELKKGRMRRKSIATYHADLQTTDPYSLTPKYTSPTSFDDTAAAVRKRNKDRRNRSFRLSLQGTIFDK